MSIIPPSEAFPAADWSSGDVRSYMKDQTPIAVDTVADVNDNDFEQARWLFVKANGGTYRLNLSSVAADDGDGVLQDSVGRRYQKVVVTGAGSPWDVQVANLAARAAYDGQATGYSVLVSDVGDGRAAVYTKNSGVSADWSAPAYFTGLGLDGAPGSSNVVGTSTTSRAIGTGSKAFTVVETDRGWGVGARLRASSDANPANFMEGLVASYSGTALTLTVDLVGGAGTFADWTINLAGERGAAGANGTNGTNGTNGSDGADGADGTDGIMASIVAGAGISVDATDPANPIVSATGGSGFPSVVDYGAVGDGSTDDTAAFAAALAAEAAVYVPGGATYMVSGLSVPSNKKLFGDGPSTVLKNIAGASAAILVLSSVNTVTLEGLAVQGDRFNQTDYTVDGIAIVGCYGINMSDLRVSGHARYGIRIANSADAANDTRTVVKDCEIVGNGLFAGTDGQPGGGLFWNKAENIDIVGCRFEGNLYFGAGSYVHNQQSYAGNGATTVFNFNFPITAAADIKVFKVNTGTLVRTEQTLTTHYTVTVGNQNGGSVTMLAAPTGSETLLIFRVPDAADVDYEHHFDQIASQNKQIGILGCNFIDNVNGIYIGTLYNLAGAQPPYRAWYNVPDNAYDDHISVIGCSFERNDFYAGIMPGNHLIIQGNRVRNNGVGNISASIVPQGRDLVISNNVFQGNGGVGLDMGLCADFNVSGNEFVDCEAFGIELASCRDGVVIGNRFRNCHTNTAHVGSGQRAVIFLDAGDDYGIYAATRRLVIANNYVGEGANQQFGIYIKAPDVGYSYEDILITGNMLKASGSTSELSDNSGLTGVQVLQFGNFFTSLTNNEYVPNRILNIRATGSGAVIKPVAGDGSANIAMRYQAIGTGGHTLEASDGGVNFRVTSTAAPTANLRANASTSGLPSLQAEGSATNIPVLLLPKGAESAGYAVGAGGAVTQATSRTTGVTLNKAAGAITLFSAAGSATFASFTVTNSVVSANDTITVSQKSGTDLYEIHVTAVAAGSFRITYRTTGGTTVEQPVFNFTVFKGQVT